MSNQRVSNILELPTEMLHRILLFVPKRYDVASVCRKMYGAVCALERNKMILKTVVCTKFDTEILPSIMNTKRTFDEMHLILPELTTTKQILRKFGQNIKKVSFLMELYSSENELVELMVLMPNLQEICLSSFCLNPLSNNSECCLHLSKLRSIFVTNEMHLDFITKVLPANILKELHVHFYFINDSVLEELLKKQTSIQTIHIPSCYPSIAVMQQLKLKRLTYKVQDSFKNWDKKCNYLKELLSCQPHLVYIDLINYRDSMYALLPVDNDIMKIMCEMENLETLITNIDRVDGDAAPYFSNLKKLKYLEIMSYSFKTLLVLDKLSLFEHLPIETFSSQILEFEIPAQTYQQMGQNFQNLRHLIIAQNKIKINFFLENFPNLESLDVCYRNKITTFLETFNAYSDSRTFPKLRSLKIEMHGAQRQSEQKHIDSLRFMLPNVKVFEIKENVLKHKIKS